MANNYRKEEFQDENGDVIYPHTDARVVFLPDGMTVYDFLNNEVTNEQINQILAD